MASSSHANEIIAESRRLDTATWRFWANHLPRVELRYIPKAWPDIAPKQRLASLLEG